MEEKGLKEENTERKGGKIRQRREARLQHAGLRERETPAEGASIPRRPRGAPRAASKGLSPRKRTTLWGGRGDGAENAERARSVCVSLTPTWAAPNVRRPRKSAEGKGKVGLT